MTEAFLWRRLDAPGHDACRLVRRGNGYALTGASVFKSEAGPAALRYAIECDDAWRTTGGAVQGWIGAHDIDFRFVRSGEDAWLLNDLAVRLEGCVDLDFGFTPATNLPTLHRIALAVGDAVDFPVAWFDVERGALAALPQHYARRSEGSYWYESPSFDYRALLEVTPVGFVEKYPELWEAA
jgi:uncharacterized protein